MPKLVITHEVADVGTWSSFTSEREAAIGQLGGSNVVDHVAHDGSKAVAVTCDVEDVDAVLAAVASPPPELGAAMERHGVIPPLTIYVTK